MLILGIALALSYVAQKSYSILNVVIRRILDTMYCNIFLGDNQLLQPFSEEDGNFVVRNLDIFVILFHLVDFKK